jgi:hypothetical protein
MGKRGQVLSEREKRWNILSQQRHTCINKFAAASVALICSLFSALPFDKKKSRGQNATAVTNLTGKLFYRHFLVLAMHAADTDCKVEARNSVSMEIEQSKYGLAY